MFPQYHAKIQMVTSQGQCRCDTLGVIQALTKGNEEQTVLEQLLVSLDADRWGYTYMAHTGYSFVDLHYPMLTDGATRMWLKSIYPSCQFQACHANPSP